VDFAFTGLDYDNLVARLEKTDTGISYEKPRAGGRIKPDGAELKWEVTFPMGVDRGKQTFRHPVDRNRQLTPDSRQRPLLV